MLKRSSILSKGLSAEQEQRLALAQERHPGFLELEEFVERLALREPLLILLYGSLATGEFTQRSDIDVLVVFSEPVEWMEVYSCSRGRVQPLVFELSRAIQELAEGNTLLIEALEDGIPLLDREGTYERLKCVAGEAKARMGLVRERRGWRREHSV
jgi:hypothetical protein